MKRITERRHRCRCRLGMIDASGLVSGSKYLYYVKSSDYVNHGSMWTCGYFQPFSVSKGGSITYLPNTCPDFGKEKKKGGPPQESLASPYVLFLMKSNSNVFTKTLFLLGPFRRVLLIEKKQLLHSKLRRGGYQPHHLAL